MQRGVVFEVIYKLANPQRDEKRKRDYFSYKVKNSIYIYGRFNSCHILSHKNQEMNIDRPRVNMKY